MTTPPVFGRSLNDLSPFRPGNSPTLSGNDQVTSTGGPQEQPCSPPHPALPHEGFAQTEDDDLNKAIVNSYEDQRNMSSQRASSGDVSQPAAKSAPARERIEVLMENLALRVSNEFAPLDDIHGDTLIYIGPPSKSPRHTASDHAHIKKHFHRMHQVDSSVLKALGSKKFGMGERQLLGPGCCIRAQKRFKKLDVYEKIDQDPRGGIKYHVDLRPPSEDDDAVLLLTDLTCTHGFRTWYQAKEKYGLPANLVLGTDELDTDSNPYQATVSSGGPGDDIAETTGASRRVEADSVINLSVSELCPLRQHSAVERMLQAIYGNDPRLDSAPKLWAFFATASFYDCAQHPSISKWIDKWLYTGKNAHFVQSNPEVAYRIGMKCELVHLVQDAYSILVGEKALLDVVSEFGGSVPSSQRSIHGREFENLDDDERNRISHAASSLVRRTRKLYQSMLIDMDWLRHCTEYKRLVVMNADDEDERGMIDSAAGYIRQFCASRIDYMLSKNLRMAFSDLDPSVRNTAAFRNGSIRDFEIVYNNLGATARPFTRSFWMALQRVQLTEGDHSSSTTAIAELSFQKEVDILVGTPTIHKAVAESALSLVNDILWDRYHRKANEIGPKAVSSTPIERSWSKSELYHPGMPYNSNAYNPAKYGTAEVMETTTHLGDHLASPKRASEPTVDSSASSPGKRRKTLEHEAEVAPDRSWQVVEDELAQQLSRVDSSSLGGDSTSEYRRYYGREPSFKDLQLPLRKSDQASESEKPTGPLVDHISGGSQASAEEHAPRRLVSPPATYQQLNVRNPDANPQENQQPVYLKQEDEQSGMPVYRMSVAQQAAMRGESTIGSQRPFIPRGTGLAPGVNTTAQAAQNIAPTHPQFGHAQYPTVPTHYPTAPTHYGNAASPTAPKPKPKVMQQFSDIPGKENWGYSKNNPWSESHPDVPRPKLFNVDVILGEMSRVLSRTCDEIVYPPHLFHGVQQTPIDLIDTLVCLDEDEWKFLPLWAGGYDDGEGGVFDEVDVPNDDAAGFKGGKRGIKSKAGGVGEGSVSGSESSFDDIADEAVSTVGRASKLATDGTATVRSVNDSDTSSDDGFMNQDDVYEMVQAMNIARMEKGKGKETDGWVPGNEFDFDNDDVPMDADDNDDGDASTVIGAGSDVQGQFFGDEGTDEGNKQIANVDESDDSDMELIDKDNL